LTYLDAFKLFSFVLSVILTIFYLYQLIYILYSIVKHDVPKVEDSGKKNRFAIFISARNEAGVIGELLTSLNNQTYDHNYYDIYLCADNCTDNTGEVAKKYGATVYERENHELVGKGYALNYMYHLVCEDKGADYYDAFMVFDADNIVDEHFIEEVNKKFSTGKYDALTTYRNSKNFGQNWLTAAYSIWFLHEARHLNYTRDSLNAQCMISGTGFVVSSALMKENEGWPYYFLTEDIQFSVASTLKNKRIGYCHYAMLYDEQPATMSQSWKQRLRWSKGFYQIDGKYIGSLIKGIFKSKGSKRLAHYDVLMTILPCSLLTIALIIIAIWTFMAAWFMPYYVKLVFRSEVGSILLTTLINYWLGLSFMGLITVSQEWKRIREDSWTKIKYIPLFPLFMLTYIPLAIEAMFVKVKWTPIQHYSTKELSQKK